MKKYTALRLAFGICLCLTQFLSPALSLAQTLAERVAAPQTVTVPAFPTPSGLTTIAINATVTVPEVERVPIFHVEIGGFDEQTALATADALGIDKTARKGFGWEYNVFESHNGEEQTNIFNICQNGRQRGYLWLSDQQDGTMSLSHLYYEDSRKGEYTVSTGMEIKPYPPERDGTRTRDEALAEAERIVNAIAEGENYELFAEGAVRGYKLPENLTKEEIAALNRSGGKDPSVVHKIPYAYAFQFSRRFAGIPLTCTEDTQTFGSIDNDERWREQNGPEPYRRSMAVSEGLNVVVLDEGIYGLVWEMPSVVKETVSEDCELLPFAEILERGKQELRERYILEEGWYQQEISFDVNVWDIRFGYMRVLDKASGRLLLTPVWDFFVTVDSLRMEDGYTRLDDGVGLVKATLSAIDGSLCPRATIYKD